MARGGFGLPPGGSWRWRRLLPPSSTTSKARGLLAGPARPRLGSPGSGAQRAPNTAPRRARPACSRSRPPPAQRAPPRPRPRSELRLRPASHRPGPAPAAPPALAQLELCRRLVLASFGRWLPRGSRAAEPWGPEGLGTGLQPPCLGRESATAPSHGTGARPGSGIPPAWKRPRSPEWWPQERGGWGPDGWPAWWGISGMDARWLQSPGGATTVLDPPPWGQWKPRGGPDVATGEVDV